MKCKKCNREVYAKGLCYNHYYIDLYHRSERMKKAVLRQNKKWRQKNRERYNAYMRELMKKRYLERMLEVKGMKVKGHFLAEEKVHNIQPGSLKKAQKLPSVPIFMTYDAEPRKQLGRAYNFKYKKGVLTCDIEVVEPKKGAQPLAVVPVFEATELSNGHYDVELVYCILTPKPVDERCFLK